MSIVGTNPFSRVSFVASAASYGRPAEKTFNLYVYTKHFASESSFMVRARLSTGTRPTECCRWKWTTRGGYLWVSLPFSLSLARSRSVLFLLLYFFSISIHEMISIKSLDYVGLELVREGRGWKDVSDRNIVFWVF